ncbi:MAG: hypothetical protein GX893_08210 [Firmicutes bacterium]|nr:hypothetical protein [Bacillota bacterium]
MRERIKTVILILLVLSSLFMTAGLLFGQPSLETAEPPAYEQVSFGELRPIREQILPVLRLGEAEEWWQLQPWHEKYQEAWERLLWLCQYAREPHKELLPEQAEGQLLRVIFCTGVDLAWWVNNDSIKGLQIQELRWYAAEPQTIWLNTDSGHWLRASVPPLPHNWQQQLEQSFQQGWQLRPATEKDLPGLNPSEELLLPQNMPVLPVYTAVAEKLDKEKLLSSIFVNLALVRRIEERDGAEIYTDGLKGLRFFQQGALEYTVPENEPGLQPLALADVLRQGALYLQLMGGWPDKLYLKEIQAAEQLSANREHWHTYELHFQIVDKGWPLVSQLPAISLCFSDQGVIYYSRQIYYLDGIAAAAAPLVAPAQALQAVVDSLNVPAEEVALSGMEPVYYLVATDQEQVLARPAWLVQLAGGQTAVVDGHTGQFYSWLDKEGKFWI